MIDKQTMFDGAFIQDETLAWVNVEDGSFVIDFPCRLTVKDGMVWITRTNIK